MKGLLFVLFMVAALVWALFTWPFRAMAKRWPGRRERQLRAFFDRYNRSRPSALRLVEIFADGLPDATAKLEASIRRTQGRIERQISQGGELETLNISSDSAWDNAIRVLERLKRIGSIDWRAEPDELKRAMAPLLTQHRIDLDWSFISDLEKSDDWNSLKMRIYCRL